MKVTPIKRISIDDASKLVKAFENNWHPEISGHRQHMIVEVNREYTADRGVEVWAKCTCGALLGGAVEGVKVAPP